MDDQESNTTLSPEEMVARVTQLKRELGSASSFWDTTIRRTRSFSLRIIGETPSSSPGLPPDRRAMRSTLYSAA